MAVLQILKMGHPILRKKASEVKNFEEVSELILNMKDTLKLLEQGSCSTSSNG